MKKQIKVGKKDNQLANSRTFEDLRALNPDEWVGRNPPTGLFKQADNLLNIDIEILKPSPFQAREDFDDESLDELAVSIENNGFFGHLLVRPKGKIGYEVAYGERRLRAAKRAGLETIPCKVEELDDQQMLEVGLVENIQREELSDYEAIKGLASLKDVLGLSLKELAERVGKSKASVGFMLQLSKSEQMMEAIEKQNLPWTTAHELLLIKSGELRTHLLHLCVTGKIGRAEVRKVKNGELAPEDLDFERSHAPPSKPKELKLLLGFRKVLLSLNDSYFPSTEEKELILKELRQAKKAISTKIKELS